jgi:hypothetical protein
MQAKKTLLNIPIRFHYYFDSFVALFVLTLLLRGLSLLEKNPQFSVIRLP